MADTKTTALTNKATLATTDLVYLVSDPSGVPTSMKATVQAIINAMLADGSALLQHVSFAASDETTALTVGTAKITFRMPFAITVSEISFSVKTAATGAMLTVDVLKNGVTVFSTVPTFDLGEKTTATATTPAVISDSAFAADDEITIDITQVGSTVAGAGLKGYFVGTQA